MMDNNERSMKKKVLDMMRQGGTPGSQSSTMDMSMYSDEELLTLYKDRLKSASENGSVDESEDGDDEDGEAILPIPMG
jgi:hypothetical protein